MKKTLKIIILIALMLLAVVALTGCGNKITATKEYEETETIPKYKEKAIIAFKNDKIKSVKITYIFDDSDKAEEYVEKYNQMILLLKAFSEEELELPELKQKGKKATMELGAEAYAKLAGSEDQVDMTKSEMREFLEGQGYIVK